MRAAAPTDRQRQLISAWLFEATNGDLVAAWLEEAYTLRELVRAIHNAGAADDYPERNRQLNDLQDLGQRVTRGARHQVGGGAAPSGRA